MTSTRARALQATAAFIAILLVGAVLRLAQIGTAPPGLYRDEAYYGLDALGVLRGNLAVFFAQNNGREGLFIYLLAPMIALLGRTPEALRLTAALVGIATLPAIYLAGRGLFGHRVGVLSMGVLAVTFWHVALSRVAFRAITLPLLLCLTVGLIGLIDIGGRRRRDRVLAAAAGICFGLTFYTYTSGQFVLIVAALFLPVLFLARRGRGHPRPPAADGASLAGHPRSIWLWFGVAAVVVLTPLAVWLLRHPELYFARAGQVSILTPDINNGDLLGTLAGNVLRALGMFNVVGDRIWRHNLSQQPVFGPMLGLLFVAGVLVCLASAGGAAWRALGRDTRTGGAMRRLAGHYAPLASYFALVWLAAFLIPTILAEDTPHFLRAIGALPAACILAAVGMEWGIRLITRFGLVHGLLGPFSRWISPPAVLAALTLGLAAYSTAEAYFRDYATRPIVGHWLEAQNVDIADDVNRFVSRRPPHNVWIDPRLLNDNAALRFLAPDVEAERVTRADAQGLAAASNAPASPVLLIADPNHDWTSLRDALPRGSRITLRPGAMAQGDLDAVPRRAFVSVLAEPMSAPPAQEHRFERGIGLDSAGTMPLENGEQQVVLAWSTTRPITEDLAVFVHWFRAGALIAQHDGTPAAGYLPLPTWKPGDEIVDKHVLRVPGGAQRGDEVRVGLYHRGDNARLGTVDASGRRNGEFVAVPVEP